MKYVLLQIQNVYDEGLLFESKTWSVTAAVNMPSETNIINKS